MSLVHKRHLFELPTYVHLSLLVPHYFFFSIKGKVLSHPLLIGQGLLNQKLMLFLSHKTTYLSPVSLSLSLCILDSTACVSRNAFNSTVLYYAQHRLSIETVQSSPALCSHAGREGGGRHG